MIKFSIVIPVYKTKQYLDFCVQSVVSQTYQNFEILLIDDGSPDCCGSLCDAWAARDPRIRTIHQENGGLSAARNTGMRNACGDYLMFLDSDDWWANDQVLAAIAANLERTQADVVSFNYQKFYSSIPAAPYFPPDLPSSVASETLGAMLQNNRWVTGACNKAVCRSLLSKQDLFFRTGITAEDIDWTLRLALCSERFSFENVCVFFYRQIASSISHSISPQKVECLCGNVQECVRLLDNAAPDKAELLKPFVAYQYGTLLHNVANLPAFLRSEALMHETNEMKWLLSCSHNRKVQLLWLCTRISGLSGTMRMLQVRQRILKLIGKGV